jgi:hypothetical protein
MSRINFLPIIINLIPQRKPGASEIDSYGWLATGELLTFEEIVGFYQCREIGILQHYLQPENIYDLNEDLTLFNTSLQMSTTYIYDDTVNSSVVPASPDFTGQSSDSV